MKVNVYDFDGTIYNGDSSIDFFKFCIKKNKKCLLILPKLFFYYILYFLKKKNKTEVKEVFFSFLNYFDDISNIINDFWSKYYRKIKIFYLEKKHDKDIIISASPEFLLKPVCDKLKIKELIASKVDLKTGEFLSLNCKGQEKVDRLFNKYKSIKIIETYTDSYSDKPLIDLANNAYLVSKNKIKKIK